MGAASVAAVGYMVKVAADFDAQMSKVQAATNATSSEMSKLHRVDPCQLVKYNGRNHAEHRTAR
jgi:hypothetical protein